jgi:non-homologous end joining protein Ku
MLALIDAKRQGQEIAEVAHPKLAPVIDLMDALKKSLEKQSTAPEKKPPVRALPAAAKDIKKTGKRAPG